MDYLGWPHIKKLGPLDKLKAFDAYQAGILSYDQYCHELAVFLGGLSAQQADTAHRAILHEPYPGYTSIIQTLYQQELVVGCLSNTNQPHWDNFFNGLLSEIEPYVSVRVASHEVEANKPDLLMFEAFEKEVELQGPEIVFFDDAEVNVKAAQSMGWRAFLIDPFGSPADQARNQLEGLGLIGPEEPI